MLVLFFSLLIGLPLLAVLSPAQSLKEFDAFYRAGSLVFGGGHVVLPLLQASVVPPGWVSNDAFLAGYGAVHSDCADYRGHFPHTCESKRRRSSKASVCAKRNCAVQPRGQADKEL
jgi:hypothetical protein